VQYVGKDIVEDDKLQKVILLTLSQSKNSLDPVWMPRNHSNGKLQF